MRKFCFRLVFYFLCICLFLYLISDKSVIFAKDCLCKGTYCGANCAGCTAPDTFAFKEVDGETTGDCLASDPCYYGNFGGFQGSPYNCDTPAWESSILCGNCTGGWVDWDYGQYYASATCYWDKCSGGGGGDCYPQSERGCGQGGCAQDQHQISQWCDGHTYYWCGPGNYPRICTCTPGTGLRRITWDSIGDGALTSISYVRSGGDIINEAGASGIECVDATYPADPNTQPIHYISYGGLINWQDPSWPQRSYINLSSGTYEFRVVGCQSEDWCNTNLGECYLNWCGGVTNEVRLQIGSTWLMGGSGSYQGWTYTGRDPYQSCESETQYSLPLTIPSDGWYTFDFDIRYVRRDYYHMYYRKTAGSGTFDWTTMPASIFSSCDTPCNSPTATLTNSPASVYECASYNLTWSSTNADSCSLKENGTQIDTRTSGTLTRSKTVANTYTYELTCTNSCGQTVTQTVNETVLANTCTITASPNPVNMCQPYTVTWSSAGASDCILSGAGSGSGTSGSIPNITKNIPGTYQYNLSCDTACASNKNCTVSEIVNPMTAAITPPATNPFICHNYTVGWGSTGGATSCTISEIPGCTDGSSGTCTDNKQLTGTYAYNLSCTNSCGSAPATDTKNVVVNDITCVPSASGLPDPVSVGTGYGVTSSFTTSHGSVSEVDFVASPTIDSVARVCSISSPAPPALCAVGEDYTYTDTTSPFGANFSVVNHNFTSSQLYVRGRINGECPFSISCTDAILPVNINYTASWFQAANGNVVSKGTLSSILPSLAYELHFIRKDPTWEKPGLLIHDISDTEPADLGGTSNADNYNRISDARMSSRTSISNNPESSFDFYYKNKLPNDVNSAINVITKNTLDASDLANMGIPTVGITARGYKTYYYDGATYGPTLTFDGDLTTLNGARLIVFVDADLVIRGKIKPQTRGKSSILIISKGNISVDYSVGGTFLDGIPDLEGVFYTDGVFSTGHDDVTLTDINLHVRGSVVAGSFSLQRDMVSGAESNEFYPGEYFTYGTEQVMAFPPFLRLRPTYWQEVNP